MSSQHFNLERTTKLKVSLSFSPCSENIISAGDERERERKRVCRGERKVHLSLTNHFCLDKAKSPFRSSFCIFCQNYNLTMDIFRSAKNQPILRFSLNLNKILYLQVSPQALPGMKWTPLRFNAEYLYHLLYFDTCNMRNWCGPNFGLIWGFCVKH